MPSRQTVFLKLGGSLITDKARPGIARPDVISRIASEIAASQAADPEMRLLLGHGSGSFGHIPAQKYGTREGVASPEDWRGFAAVWHEAARLNHLIVASLYEAGIPAVSFPPSAACITRSGKIESWPTASIETAIEHGLTPVVYGDVTIDRTRGGTIVSTEDVFAYLAGILLPDRILIAGIEEGVWADFPVCSRLIESITPASFSQTATAISGSAHTDVTGGMDTKVREMLALVEAQPAVEVRIFGGGRPGAVGDALSGEKIGTRIAAQ